MQPLAQWEQVGDGLVIEVFHNKIFFYKKI